LKQPEFSPISVPAQIAILLAISAELFDEIPLNRIDEAERAVQQAAEAMPDDLRERLFTADTLKAEDREAITEIARQALGTFFSGGRRKPFRPKAKR
jgi:F-type H+-transporting ATPase subunit alpha